MQTQTNTTTSISTLQVQTRVKPGGLNLNHNATLVHALRQWLTAWRRQGAHQTLGTLTRSRVRLTCSFK